MLEHSIYSVISPEGCASILWRDPTKSLEAAEAMKLTSEELLKLRIIDEVIPEPLGGAHRDADQIALDIKSAIIKNLKDFENLSGEQIYDQRKSRFLKIGRDQGFKKSSDTGMLSGLGYLEPKYNKILRLLKNKKNIAPRGLETYEVLNHSTCVDMTQPIVTFQNRCMGTDMHKFMPAEAAFILTGRNTAVSYTHLTLPTIYSV